MRPDQEELFRRAISLARRIDFLLLREFRDGLEFAGPARGPEHGLQESDVPVDRCAFGSVLLARLDESADRGLRDGRDLPGSEELVQVDHAPNGGLFLTGFFVELVFEAPERRCLEAPNQSDSPKLGAARGQLSLRHAKSAAFRIQLLNRDGRRLPFRGMWMFLSFVRTWGRASRELRRGESIPCSREGLPPMSIGVSLEQDARPWP